MLVAYVLKSQAEAEVRQNDKKQPFECLSDTLRAQFLNLQYEDGQHGRRTCTAQQSTVSYLAHAITSSRIRIHREQVSDRNVARLEL